MIPVDDRVERLIVRSLDGEITEEEQLELNRELLRSPEAQELLEDYKSTDAIAAESLKSVIPNRSSFSPVLLLPRATVDSHCRRNRWMVFASAVAASLSFLLYWQAPDPVQVTQSVLPSPSVVAQVSPGQKPVDGVVRPMVGNIESSAGVWRVAEQQSRRVDRLTDRNVILVPGENGEFYILNVDRVREVRQPRSESMQTYLKNPI